MRTISSSEYQLLTAFCNKHGVKYYDLQVELNDHLANAIEAIWAAQPEMPFEQALDQVYNGFGKTGFRAFIKSKEKACQQRANTLFWNAFRSYFKWPHAVFTILLVSFYGMMYLTWSNANLVLIINILSVVILLVNIIVVVRYSKQKQTANYSLLALKYDGNSILASLPNSLLAVMISNFLESGTIFFATISFPLFIMISSLQIICALVAVANYQSNIEMVKQAKVHYPKAFL